MSSIELKNCWCVFVSACNSLIWSLLRLGQLKNPLKLILYAMSCMCLWPCAFVQCACGIQSLWMPDVIIDHCWLVASRLDSCPGGAFTSLPGNFFRPPRLPGAPRRRCRYLFHSTRQALQLPNSRGPMRARQQFCPANQDRDRNQVDPIGEAGSVGPGGPMRKAHGAALMCHSLQRLKLADGERSLLWMVYSS